MFAGLLLGINHPIGSWPSARWPTFARNNNRLATLNRATFQVEAASSGDSGGPPFSIPLVGKRPDGTDLFLPVSQARERPARASRTLSKVGGGGVDSTPLFSARHRPDERRSHGRSTTDREPRSDNGARPSASDRCSYFQRALETS